MYLSPVSVDKILSDILHYSAKNSRIVFDYYPKSLVDGTNPLPMAEKVRKFMFSVGEPVLFGVPDNGIEHFLEERGYTGVHDITREDFVRMYFSGSRSVRGEVTEIHRCVSALVP